MIPESQGNANESGAPLSAPAATPEDPLSHVFIPQEKMIARVDYETRHERSQGEIVAAATLVFSDGAELWIDLSANAGRVALTHAAPQAAPWPGNSKTINDPRNNNNY